MFKTITLIAALLAAALILAFCAEASAAQDPHGREYACPLYGCWYGHEPQHYSRGGEAGETRYAFTYEALPDGPDSRFLDRVEWPQGYYPGRRAMWDDVAMCESTQRWHIESGNGYSGGLQFSASTWRAYGGTMYASRASYATPEQQIAIAENVLREGYGRSGPQGKGAWPHCGRSLRR